MRHLDPVPIMLAMTAVVGGVSFLLMMSTTSLAPFLLARQMSTYGQLPNERCVRNIVSTNTKGYALALGTDDIIPHDERYVISID